MDFIKNPKSTVGMQNGQTIHFIQRIKSVDKAIIKNKRLFRLNTMILLYIDIDIKGNALYKTD
jgi:hypothetical protein